MRIIKEGKKIAGVMRVICKNCNAELEIEARDIKELSDDDYTSYSYKCPCCSQIQYLSYCELSEEIRFNLKTIK